MSTSEQERIYQDALNAGHAAAWELDWETAAHHYHRALQSKPNDYQALISLGLALYESRRLEDALWAYAQAAHVAPQQPVPWEKLAQIYERLTQPKRAAKAAFQAAERFLKQGEPKRAIDNYLRAVRLQPDFLAAHARLAALYDRYQEIDQAVRAYLATAALLQKQGKTEAAHKAVARALALAPDHPQAKQAMAALKRGVPLAAPQALGDGTHPLRGARPLHPVPPTAATAPAEPKPAPDQPSLTPVEQSVQKALSMLAEALFAAAESEADDTKAPADETKLEALMQGITSPHARQQQRGRLLLLLSQVVEEQSQGNFAAAAANLQRAVAAGLTHPAAHFDLGYLLTQTQQPETAIPYLKQATTDPQFSLAAHLLAAQSHQLTQQPHEAAQHALEALRLADMTLLSPEQAEAVSQGYEPLLEQIGLETDTEALNKVTENILRLLNQPDWQNRLQQARQQLSPRADGTPAPVADLLLEVPEGSLVDTLSTIQNLMQRNALQAALEEAHLALLQAPTFLPLHTLTADILVRRGMTDVAEEKYLAVARTYLARGNPGRAMPLYHQVLELNPTHVEAHARLIESLLQQNRLEDALEHYAQMGKLYYQLADLQRAEQAYRHGLELAGRLSSEARRRWETRLLRPLADLAEQRLDWRQAVEYYTRLRARTGEDPKIQAKLAHLYLNLGRSDDALAEVDKHLTTCQQNNTLQQEGLPWLKELLVNHPDSAELYIRLAQVHAMLGQKHEAIEAYDTAGEKFLDRGDLPRAIEAIKAILTLGPVEAEAYRQALEHLQNQLTAGGMV